MAATTLVTVMAATIMLVSSASLSTSSPDVATTTESQRATTAKEEMNQCIDRLQLDDRCVLGSYLVYTLTGSCWVFQEDEGITQKYRIAYIAFILVRSTLPLITSL